MVLSLTGAALRFHGGGVQPGEAVAPAAASESSMTTGQGGRATVPTGRVACSFVAGTRAKDTLVAAGNPGSRLPRNLPIKHVLILMQENRSYDHYFGRLPEWGQPDAEAIPASFGNRDAHGRFVRPFHLPSTCIPADPPHQWDNMRAHWNQGRMDGFIAEAARHATRAGERVGHVDADGDDDDDDDDDVTAKGRFALGYYDARDIPFYYYLANTFTIADRYFSAVMAGTWPNRQVLYAGTAQKRRTRSGTLTGTRTLFDNLDAARVSWTVYGDGPVRQDCIGWTRDRPGVRPLRELSSDLAYGTLPAVAFIDPGAEDEHPPADVQRGERWVREIFQRLVASPNWADTALFITYDEGGGLFDHVPPPRACAPDAERAELDQRGTRVPLLVVSPWAKRHSVAHAVYDHASLLRFIELLHDLPALSARDANADALLEAFDFQSPPRLAVPPPPAAGHDGCRPHLLTADGTVLERGPAAAHR